MIWQHGFAMACRKCKHVMVQHVTKDSSHVKLMTIGEKHKCVCGGKHHHKNNIE